MEGLFKQRNEISPMVVVLCGSAGEILSI